MKAAIVRLMTGIWIIFLFTASAAIVVAPSAISAQEAGDELSSLHRRIETTIGESRKIDELIKSADGDLRTMLERRLEEKQLQIVDDINELSEEIIKEEAAGKDLAQMRKVMIDYLQRLMPAFQKVIARENKKVISLLSGDPPEDLRAAMSREIAMNKTMTTLVDWYSDYHLGTGNLDAFGIDATKDREYLNTNVTNLAELLADTIDFTSQELEDVGYLLTLTPDDKDLQTRAKLIELRRETAVTNLTAIADLLEKLEIDAADYRSLVLRVSGDVSTRVLETDVWTSLLQQWGQNVWTWSSENGLDWVFKIVFLLIILYAARALSRLVRRVVQQAVDRLNLSNLLRRMIVATAANGVFILGILIALSQVGISIGPLLAGLGIAGIIIGFALQDTLSNFASGMMILLYRPYDVGDLIDAGGEFGTVTDMSLVSTVVLTIDNQKLVIPNNLIWGGIIRNITAERTRRIDMTFGVSYDDDIPKVERILEEILRAHELVLDDPEPIVKLHTLGESSVDFVARPWVKTDDYWDVYWDITREVKLRFDAEGISIPFPQRDVHVYGTDTASAPARETSSAAPVRSTTHGPDIEEAES
jgi:small conductance mechanosensitive channel